MIYGHASQMVRIQTSNEQNKHIRLYLLFKNFAFHNISMLAIALFWFCFDWFVLCVYSSKDKWLVEFERDARIRLLADNKLTPPCDPDFVEVARTSSCVWRIPRYLPARNQPNETQLIPRYLFQTWRSDMAAGPNHFQCVMSFIRDNPEYEYYLIDDSASWNFIRTYHPEYAPLFEKVIPGAMRADILRLALIARYGGVYFDSDSCSAAPLRQFVWSNASVVSGVGSLGDFHQWALLYQANHIFVRNALKFAFFRLNALYKQKVAGSVSYTTGPGAFHAAMKEVFLTHNCSIPMHVRKHTDPTDVLRYLPNHYCSREVGVMQVFAGDHLGGNVVFKNVQAEHEMRSFSVHYSHSQRQFSTLFRADQSSAVSASVKIGERDPKKFSKKRVRTSN